MTPERTYRPGDGVPELPEYGAVSRLAVAALAVGLLSALALALPLLVALAMAGTGLAVAALWTIARSDGLIVGRRAALAGLSLSLFFGAWAVARDALTARMLYAEARPLAEKWLELVCAGRLQEAHQLHKPEPERQPADTALDGYYAADREARQDLGTFFGGGVPQHLTDWGPRAHVRFDGNVSIEEERVGGLVQFVTLRFACDNEDRGRPTTLKFTLILARERPPREHEARWYVRAFGQP